MSEMQQWLNARCVQLLTEINNTPLADNSEEVKMQLIMTAMRESSVEMFHRAAEKSRKQIEKINSESMQEAIQDIENLIAEGDDDLSEVKLPVKEETNEEAKEEPKIKLKSSVIRRVDSF